MLLKEVSFEFNSDQMIETKESSDAIKEITKLLKQHVNAHVEVVGHTDSWGLDLYNETLSLNRAQSVSEQLEERGIERERITAKGMGEGELTSCRQSNAGNRALNRRVEIIISSFKY
ncbi:OmpA family protein [Vibrio sp. Sgm 22]|uniref:OmpA family protein n=1 Tax=unclassified Vibrio TaxID=2614977 RepID=UPI0022488A70|nr:MULTISPECIES: OmpA family protein [unclassified Vibrio]MCX2757767.1 OmpA family protein [Vibrio sp. 14G-20]MCX2774955.1 OmpA family protein [Vibrio sp. Sgm 22]